MTDGQLIQIVDAALAEASRRSGAWLVCGPGCNQCCKGPFEITALDAARLQTGLTGLDPERAAKVLERARLYMERAGEATLQQLLEEDGMDEELCPALDPSTGMCDLYDARPVTCRTFGPPALSADGSYCVCELCYSDATEEQIAACWVDPDPEGLEAQLLKELPERSHTFVGAALLEACGDRT